jgi:hypothetical protein
MTDEQIQTYLNLLIEGITKHKPLMQYSEE